MQTTSTAPFANNRSIFAQFYTYVARVGEFNRTDWLVYLGWVGLMSGLVFSTGGFLWIGHRAGAIFPQEAYLVPIGAFIFAVAISIDTIGHRTIYKEALKGGEAMVHHIIIFNGIGSCILLCAAYPQHAIFAGPAAVLTVLSFLFSWVDEAFHWRRYVTQQSDPVEMWSHVFILIGHGIMMYGWWAWYLGGYQGVAETVPAFWGLL